MKRFLLNLLVIFLFATLMAETEIQKAKENELENDVILSISTNVQEAMANPDYLVTAGDVYSLSYSAGNVPVTYNIYVDSTYKIRVANLAKIDAKGKSFIDIKKEVEDIVNKYLQ